MTTTAETTPAVQNAESPKVVIAWISPGETSMFFTTSLTLMLLRDRMYERHVTNMLPLHSGVNIAHARNDSTLRFLDDNPQADYLLWVDSDMEFEPDALTRLVASADPVERPIIGGLCFGEDAETGLFPTVYKFAKDPHGRTQCIRLGDYPEDALFEVAATGAAFLLIHRGALEAMRAQNFNPVFPFFQELEMYDKPVGEDIAFCARARSTRTDVWPNGIPIFVNTAVKIGHHKSHILTADKFRKQQGATFAAPPAAEPVDVIVPTLHRPQNAEPFMRSLVASTGLATAYAVCDEDDQESIEAWEAAGAVVVKGCHSFPAKCNLGFTASGENTNSPWVLIVGDDVVFRPGWWDEAFALREGYDVIGTNDLGTQRVQQGEHATHIIMRRSYVEQEGASWDGPGVLAHESYGHWFVDDELVTVAKQRDTWVSAKRSVIEHFHPLFGKAPEDDTYIEGQKSRFEDEALFRARVAMYVDGAKVVDESTEDLD